jgi:hypothetical protein
MDSSNNKVNDILDTANWSDALLVKDAKGNLGSLTLVLKDNSPKISPSINAVSEGSLAPKDASFAPSQNIIGNSQTKSELVFHPDDKEELDFFAQNIVKDDSKKYSVEKIVDRIIAKQSLDLDEKNKKIFVNILYNFFRNRKSTIITRELLTNSVLIKNKKIDTEVIDIILSVIKGIKNKIDAVGGLVVNQTELKIEQNLSSAKEKKHLLQTPPVLVKPFSQEEKILDLEDSKDSSLSAQDEVKMALGQLQPTVVKESKVETKAPVVKAPAAGFSIPAPLEKLSKPDKPELKEEIIKPVAQPEIKASLVVQQDEPELAKVETSLPKVLRSNLNQTPKKPISDVVSPIKEVKKPNIPVGAKNVLMGAVQELQSFDLVGFRRLGSTANERVQKIFDKINLLEQESYTKKAQGIAAWRDSEVYKLYLQLGTESMIAGQEVANFILERQSKNQNTLSIEEFSAISDLNKQLRF